MTNHANNALNNEELKVIEAFEQDLEQFFMTKTKVVINSTTESFIHLAIQIDFNFTLPEVVSLTKMVLKKENSSNRIQNLVKEFKNDVGTLNKVLSKYVDIEEVSFYFKNTSIVINSIEYKSIVDELDQILIALVYHFDFYATEMGSVPNEIQIPVLEDLNTHKHCNLNELENSPNYSSPYSKYWGLLFDFLDKPLIYNLERTNIIPGDLNVSLD